MEGTILGAELRYQPWWWLGESGSVVCCRHCLVNVLSISSHYRWCYLLSLIPMSWYLSSLKLQPHRLNQKLESSSVSIFIFRIYLNCFQRSIVQSEKGRWARETVNSVNCQQTKNTKSTIQKVRNILLSGWLINDLPWYISKVSTSMVTWSKHICCVISSLFSVSCSCLVNVISLPVSLHIVTTTGVVVLILTILTTT